MTEPLAETRKAAARAEREKRLAAALRENLQRRKEQTRTQDTVVSEEETQKPQRSA